jgi:hypothetical protein
MVRTRDAWLPLRRPFAVACASALAALVACGGKQVGDEARDGGSTTLPDGAVCVDIDLSSYDQSCTTDSDCAVVTSGELCANYCPCGGSTINESQLGRYRAAVADVPTGECGCGLAGPPSCVSGTCQFCSMTPGNDGLPACPSDAGASDASTGSDAGQCVDIDLASYDSSCTKASDCTLIPTGEVCSGSCECGASPINLSGVARFKEATAGITFADCPCISPGPLDCIGGTCTLCSGSPLPAGCADGG